MFSNALQTLLKNKDVNLKTHLFQKCTVGSVSRETLMMYVGSQQGGEGGRPHAHKF